ncbi:hypothetical protein FQA39_LY00508 [Lamprigera yunnana]|nr:hypothetical protein FQA39_LY00508 [Lamprigera yunnana]
MKDCVQGIINVIGVDYTVLHNPVIRMNIGKNLSNLEHYNTYKEVVVLDIRFIDMSLFADYGLWQPYVLRKRKFLIINTSEGFELEGVFDYLWDHNIMDGIVLFYIYEMKSIKVFTSDPHHPKNKCGQLVNVMEEYTCDSIKTMQVPNVSRKYNNCNITVSKLVHFQLQKSHTFYDLNKDDYIVLFVLRTILDTLQLKAIPSPKKYMEEFRVARLKFCKFHYDVCATPYLHSDFVWIVTLPKKIHALKVFKIIFNTVVWMLILLSFFIMSVVWWLLYKCTGRISYTSALLDVYSMTLLGAVSKVSSFLPLRVLLCSYIIYAVHIQAIFSSGFLQLLLVLQYEPAIKNLQELSNSNLSIIVMGGLIDFLKNDLENDELFNKIQNKLLVYDDEISESL